MQRRIRGILFDLGDTLLDFGKVNAPRLFEAGAKLAYARLRRLNQPMPPFWRYYRQQLWAIRWNYLRSRLTGREFCALDLMRRIGQEFGQQLTDEQLLEQAWLWYRPLSRCARVEEGLADLLADLRKNGMVLGVVSNTFIPAPVLDRHLAQVGLLEHLPVRIYSCVFGYRKPRREIFQEACRQTGLRPCEIAFVGDSPRADIYGAWRMGMWTALKDPAGRYDGRRTRADVRVRNVLELPEALDRIGGNGKA